MVTFDDKGCIQNKKNANNRKVNIKMSLVIIGVILYDDLMFVKAIVSLSLGYSSRLVDLYGSCYELHAGT